MTFIITEDEALKDLLKGMTVSDNKESTRSVGVWFGQPDPEIRQQQFPFVTIDLIDVRPAPERMMSAQQVSPWYFAPESFVDDAENVYDSWSTYMPIPVDLDYQVTIFSRQPRHDRQIMSQIFQNRLPFKFGSLVCKEKLVEEVDSQELWDATVRRLDVLGVRKRDTVESGKRLFMNAITVRVSSEMKTPFLDRLYKKVQTINGTFVPGNESFTISASDVTPSEPITT
jgi:hypothetical protein